MKRRLYPVIKHGARFALAGVAVTGAYFFFDFFALVHGDFLAGRQLFLEMCWRGSDGVTVTELLLIFNAVMLTLLAWQGGNLLNLRRLRNSPEPKLQADPSAPLLAAGEQVGGIEAG